MLPVVEDYRIVASRIVRYSYAMVATSLVLIPVAPMGWFYAAAAVLLGAGFLWEAHALQRRVGTARVNPMRLFHGSITYLALLFLAIGIDPFLA
jgi:protoheme IX farnesyltransferase